MHGLSAVADDRRNRPARTDAPLTAHPTRCRPGRVAASTTGATGVVGPADLGYGHSVRR
ncbi:hypothetical protein [Micromonospora sp. NPDC005806]|uniref:hypothetical protein n=1 Tax=Micromonospora sp. NPDC005806 TaxID=3364234 RepID=UPI003696F54E